VKQQSTLEAKSRRSEAKHSDHASEMGERKKADLGHQIKRNGDLHRFLLPVSFYSIAANGLLPFPTF
jgi:hypothetical protein